MIVENERENIINRDSDIETSSVAIEARLLGHFQDSLLRRWKIRDRETHNHLKTDLVEHIWQRYGNNDI